MEQLTRRQDFTRQARVPAPESLRLGPQVVTATTTGAAHTLYNEDADSRLKLGVFTFRNSTAGALTVYLMIDAVTFFEESIAANDSEAFDFGGVALYASEALKVYASGAGVTVTGAADRVL